MAHAPLPTLPGSKVPDQPAGSVRVTKEAYSTVPELMVIVNVIAEVPPATYPPDTDMIVFRLAKVALLMPNSASAVNTADFNHLL